MMSSRFFACCWLSLAGAVYAAPLSRIGVSVGALDNPFYQIVARGALNEARAANPNAQVTTLSANFSLERQEEQVRQLLRQQVELILLVAADSKAVAPLVRLAHQAGVRVVAVDVDAPGVDGTVKSDNVQAGALACRYLAEQMHGSGTMVIQSGPPVSSVWDRVAGCRRSLAAFPKIRLLSHQESGMASSWGGKRLMERHLRRYPMINGVFSCNDRQALGAEQAAREAGRKEVMVAGVDGSPDIEKALRGRNQIVASVSQAPYAIGVAAVKLGRQLLDKPKAKPSLVLVPVQLITRANIGAYQGWQSQLPPSPAAAR